MKRSRFCLKDSLVGKYGGKEIFKFVCIHPVMISFLVGSLLSCLHQLRAENDDLELRLGQLSSRRDRLIAATSRLSTPFDAHAELSHKLPLSSMLSKLNGEPGDKKPNAKEKKTNKLKLHESDDSSLNKRAKKVKIANDNDKQQKSSSQDEPEGYSDSSSLDGLGCKEILSEDNSLNSSPKDIKTNKLTKKATKIKEISFNPEETRNDNSGVRNLQSLVQPAISMPSDPMQLIGNSRHMHNSPELLQQMMQPQQNNANRNNVSVPSYQATPTMLEFLTAQLTSPNNNNGNNKSNGYINRSPDTHVAGTYRPVASGNSNSKSPQQVSYILTVLLSFFLKSS